MTADRISELVATGESETLEFKRTTGQRSDAAKTLCAMLNQRGGHVNNRYTAPQVGSGDPQERRAAILAVLANRPLAISEISDRLVVRASRNTLLGDLAALRDQGLVALTGRGRSAGHRRLPLMQAGNRTAGS